MTQLRITEAVPLGYALVARVAHDAGVRALCIKGPRSEELGLREPRVSIDVDVLTSPAEFPQLMSALQRQGWVEKPLTRGSLINDMHSSQLVKAEWGIEVDCHRRFPGFFADPSDVFETLWERRETWSVADTVAWAPDETASVLIDLLHYAREPRRQRRKLAYLLSQRTGSLAPVIALARELDALDAIAPHIEVDDVPHVLDGARAGWALQAQVERQTAVAALHELRRTTWSRRPLVIWRLVWLPAEEVLARQPQLRGKRLAVPRARMRRWRRGIRALPSARRALRG